MARKRTEQEQFWAEDYAREYMAKNSSFDRALGVAAWRQMLRKANGIESLLECGCNIGRNLMCLEQLLPNADKSVIEISKPAYDFVCTRYALRRSFNGAILECDFPEKDFDLVFTMGVLIHVSPDDLLLTMERIYKLSRRYILFGEYFNRTPVMIEYRGLANKLYKRDFGKLFLENFSASVVDYGFLWGHVYDAAGFDDITWWLLEKAG